MKDNLKRILESAKKEIDNVIDKKALEEYKTKFLGKKGLIKDTLGKIGSLSIEAKKEIGAMANDVKSEIELMIEKADLNIDELIKKAKLANGVADISVPMEAFRQGFFHPISLTTEKMINVFIRMGYSVVEGPEVEDDFHNFEALGIPSYHPARDDHDSFYIDDNRLLRTHTSPVQIRTMMNKTPPIAVVVPGKCFRRDATDATHSPTFYQMEGLVVDKDVTFADLTGTLLLWAKLMYGEDTKVRFRPDFFPFTEPSLEVAVSCVVCKGVGCPTCKHTGYIELGGAGMVDPVVFKNVGYDPNVYSGFAFGFGIERIAMKAYNIKDIRQFYENDMRLLEQFVK